ncbi:MAG: DUF4307 domain-containing protein [Nocardioidaceae bacterium]
MTVPVPALAQRYGTPSRHHRPLVITGVAALALVGLAWLLWVVLFHGRPQVTSEMVGFDIDGQHAAVARFTVVRRDATVPASCLLRAYADDHSVVGELTVPVDSTVKAVNLSSTVRTERRATTVALVGCTAPGQRAPR